MSAYYNEIEPFAAQWLRNLIKEGLITDGEVDTRSIVDVAPDDLRGFTQCHFFAGIGGWSLAARLAGWPDDRPIWTGSAPCQPFSTAGQQKGTADKRHLWPVFFGLIRACRPPVVMGEQVAAAVGKDWLDGVCADLESVGYACGAVVVPACAVNAPHRRDRLWFVADADHERRREEGRPKSGRRISGGGAYAPFCSLGALADAQSGGRGQGIADTGGLREGDGAQGSAGRSAQHGDAWVVADANCLHGKCGQGSQSAGVCPEEAEKGSDNYAGGRCASFWSDHIWLTGAGGKAWRARANIPLLAHGLSDNLGRMCPEGYAQAVEEVDKYAQKTGQSRSEAMSAVQQIISQEPETFWPMGKCAGVSPQEVLFPFLRELSSACDAGRGTGQSEEIQKGEMRGLRDQEQATRSSYRREPVEQRSGEHSNPVRELSWILAQHARALWEVYWRSNATAYPLLSHGEKNRVGRLRAYGNAIVPQVAAEVIAAFMEMHRS